MSKWDKLIQRIKTIDHDLRFTEIQKVMESFGYTGSYPKGGSSHCTFRKPGCNPVTIPTHEPIAEVYVKTVKRIVEREGK
ncbi:MAG: type II toxin-antitoxin system HicA family toxin [Lachnospiraceae bacterium]|nr:type II toxin-antitoxin system HicA family toxin [Lachnospiraceae bacterium]